MIQQVWFKFLPSLGMAFSPHMEHFGSVLEIMSSISLRGQRFQTSIFLICMLIDFSNCYCRVEVRLTYSLHFTGLYEVPTPY